ncbi:MAG TPA: single-stranded-DNA-specific exonuclease RecJ [Chthoniobacterales bacterium]|nr:single-stranded-DNA-specific exonuclease RecJ [Chthoniobacterales bacterium]
MERRWIIAPAEFAAAASFSWSEICDLPCIVAFLRQRGLATADEVASFLQPRLRSLGDPFFLPGIAAAVPRIFRAVDAGERVVLFGDYDVDGVTSLALLAEMLRAYGAAPSLFLPLRMEEGYGLNRESVERCWDQHKPELLIAVDCGTSSTTEIAELKRRGADVIVLDHHEPKSELPECVALVNPKVKSDCALHYLCSVGVVFKLCHALLKTRPLPAFDLKARLDLVALGTVADIVPLEGENRVLVQRGTREIGRSTRPGIRKLLEVAAVHSPVGTEDIGFRLGPRLNAAGRLATAEKSLQLLLTTDENEAAELATFLDRQNRERQTVEKCVFAAADEQVVHVFDPENDAAIVVGGRGWHPGVVGIVASRLVRKYHRPTIVIGFDESGTGKGSGRSIEGLSIVEALSRCDRWLEKFGGHEMAAGLTVREENLESFGNAFRNAARALLTKEQLQACLHVDHELSFAELTGELLRWHDMLQPFGSGNQQPVFFARTVEPVQAPQILKEKHLVLRLRQRNHHQRAIYFDGAADPLPEPPWDVAFRIQSDEYGGEVRLQMQVQSVRAAQPR